MKRAHLSRRVGRIWLASAAIASLLMFGGIAKGKTGFPIMGMRVVDEEWQTITIEETEYWVVDTGALWYADPAECKLWDIDQDCAATCGANEHKIGDDEWPRHLYVDPEKTWPTTPDEPENIPEITQEETQKMWYISIYLGGTWDGKELRKASGSDDGVFSLGKDGSDGQIIYSDADFHSNCHGYALDQAGLSRFRWRIPAVVYKWFWTSISPNSRARRMGPLLQSCVPAATLIM